MRKFILLYTSFIILFLFTIYYLPTTVYAGICHNPSDCADDEVCAPSASDPSVNICTPAATSGPLSVFGKIKPPSPINSLGIGGEGISKFLNNFLSLVYIMGAVLFVFMIVWSGLEWISSGGDKEKVGNAQKRITNALIGLVIFAVAFAIFKLLGTFTGFQFFQ